MTKPLSPAARAVWEAAMNTPDHMPYEYGIAAALEATVDQVLPENANPVGDEHDDAFMCYPLPRRV